MTGRGSKPSAYSYEEIYEKIKTEFDTRIGNNKVIQSYLESFEKGDGTYEDLNDFAVKLGEELSSSFFKVLDSGQFQYESMNRQIANDLIKPLLKYQQTKVINECGIVQQALNQAAGLKIKPADVKVNGNKIQGIADKFISYEEYEQARWVLGEPVVNLAQSGVTDSIYENADLQYKAGFSPVIVRKAESGACKWCRSLAGVYKYEDVKNTGNDVYRRHQRCRCTVTYDPRDGKKLQDVWSKRTKLIDPVARARRIKQLKLDELPKNVKDVTRTYYAESTPGRGTIDHTSEYNFKKYNAEAKCAEFIHKALGGDIYLQVPNNNKKSSDYIWNDAYWELKSCSTVKSSDSAIRAALKQIEELPGGIIIEMGTDVDLMQMVNTINDRIGRSMHSFSDIDIMFIRNMKIEKILNYSQKK